MTIDQARDISRRLEVPVHLLRLGDAGGDDPAKRRDFGKAMALAFMPVPKRMQVDESTAPNLTAITGGQRRLDATTPARDLARGAIANADMANRVFSRTKSAFTGEVAAAVSEAAGFAAWLHADMRDIGTARTYYRLAIDRAHRAGNPLLACYMLGSFAAFEIDEDDALFALELIADARRVLDNTSHPTPRAWLASIEALGHAAAGSDTSGDAADRALLAAGDAINGDSNLSEPPPWPWMFPFDYAKLSGYKALVEVRLNRPAEALAAFAESIPAVQQAPKQRAIVMLEVATAARQGGICEKDTAKTNEAFRLAGEAITIGVAYASERVIQRARRFRRGYKGPMTEHVRHFDQQLRSLLP